MRSPLSRGPNAVAYCVFVLVNGRQFELAIHCAPITPILFL